MSSSDFRQIAGRSESGKSERLFRAAISAFCCLPRPSRREIAQIEDLTLPLFDSVSVESRRFVAAALSECEYPPAALVRRLAEEPVDIAAPLLIRSNALADIDLVSLIGRHGLPHARAIARRKELSKPIADLIKVLERPSLARVSLEPSGEADRALPQRDERPSAATPHIDGAAAEATRNQLRAIMATQQRETAASSEPQADLAYPKLRATALTGNTAFFQTALADVFDLDFATARSLTESSAYSSLSIALRALDLDEHKAFLITAAAFPRLFMHPQAIRLFLDRYRSLHADAARQRVEEWKKANLAGSLPQAVHTPANADRPETSRPAGLKAS